MTDNANSTTMEVKPDGTVTITVNNEGKEPETQAGGNQPPIEPPLDGEVLPPPKEVASPPPAQSQGRDWWGFAQIVAMTLGVVAVGHAAVYYLPKAGDPKPAVVEAAKPNDTIVQILDLKKHYLRVKRADGKIEQRTGGNLSWRFNNHAKLRHGEYARSKGSLGSDGKYAVFPSADAGLKAAEGYFFEGDLKDLSIKDAILKAAPKKDGYKPDVYTKTVAKAAGVSVDAKMSSLDDAQRKQFLGAVRGLERWNAGKVTVFENEEDWKKRGW